MPREIYELSDESRKVLSDDVKGIADEMDKSAQHIYSILNGDTNDPFAMFLPIYSAVVRAKGKAHIYRNKLDEVDARYEQSLSVKSEKECFTDKIRKHSETLEAIINAMSDGELDEREISIILDLIEKEEKCLEYMKTSMNFLKAGIAQGKRLKAV